MKKYTTAMRAQKQQCFISAVNLSLGRNSAWIWIGVMGLNFYGNAIPLQTSEYVFHLWLYNLKKDATYFLVYEL